MNQRFQTYLETLTPAKKALACKAVNEYLAGDSDVVEKGDTPLKIYTKFRHLSLSSEEHACVLLMKQNFSIIKAVELCNGSQTKCFFDVRAVIREALLNMATTLAIVHNHPSGSTKPSKSDDEITTKIAKACEIMRLHLIDHVIIADNNYYSYHENGKL